MTICQQWNPWAVSSLKWVVGRWPRRAQRGSPTTSPETHEIWDIGLLRTQLRFVQTCRAGRGSSRRELLCSGDSKSVLAPQKQPQRKAGDVHADIQVGALIARMEKNHWQQVI